jgi:hypothetical protein
VGKELPGIMAMNDGTKVTNRRQYRLVHLTFGPRKNSRVSNAARR